MRACHQWLECHLLGKSVTNVTILQLQYLILQQFFLVVLILQRFCGQLPTTGNRLWKNNAGRVDCLKDSAAVDASCHLAYQHRCHALWTQLLVYAQEVNFNHPLLTTHTHTHQFLSKSVGTVYPTVHCWRNQPASGFQGQCFKMFQEIQNPKHPMHYLLPPVKVSNSQIVLLPTYPYQLPLSKSSRYGRDFIPYSISKKF